MRIPRLRRAIYLIGRNTTARIVLRTALVPLLALTDLISRSVPRDPRLVVFGAAGDRLGDNSFYLYDYVSRHAGEIRAVWITSSRNVHQLLRRAGYQCCLRWSPAGIWSCLRAAAYVYSSYVSDINRWFWRGAVTINLWHGVPLKRIERDMISGQLGVLHERAKSHPLVRMAFAAEVAPPSLILAPSKYIRDTCFLSAFGLPAERFLVCGYPRNDYLQGKVPPPTLGLLPSRALWRRLGSGAFVVGYFPTWREPRMRTPSSWPSLKELGLLLKGQEAELLFKPHFNDAAREHLDLPENVHLLKPGDDIHSYLGLCDVLITDYSSIAFDFMILERPIIYFVPDIDTYRQTRGLYFDAEDVMPGPLVKDVDSLYSLVRDVRGLRPSERVQTTARLVWDDQTTCSSERIAGALATVLDDFRMQRTRQPSPRTY